MKMLLSQFFTFLNVTKKKSTFKNIGVNSEVRFFFCQSGKSEVRNPVFALFFAAINWVILICRLNWNLNSKVIDIGNVNWFTLFRISIDAFWRDKNVLIFAKELRLIGWSFYKIYHQIQL